MAELLMTFIRVLENIARTLLPPALCRLFKRILVYPRYLIQAHKCKQGFAAFGKHYSQKILFVAGLPKSGTTWLERMLCCFPGFSNILIPDVERFGLQKGGSHNYDLPMDTFSRFRNMLAVTKMHVHGSDHNVELLRKAGIKHVVVYRDLRDVAISYYFYVRQTPWHGEYPVYAPLTLRQGLEEFAGRLLLEYVDWIRYWHKHKDSQMLLIIRYEDMLADTHHILTKIAEHFELDSRIQTITRIVQANSFGKLSGGRKRGDPDTRSFFRSGTTGQWREHFSSEIKEIYKNLIGEFLMEFGYEQDSSW